MLKFKLSKKPPTNSCLVGFYTGTGFNINDNLAIRDYSWEWAENRTGLQDKTKTVRYGTPWDAITSGDVVVGNTSARRRDLTRPVPLPWGHRIGDNTALGAQELLVYNPLADGIDPSTEPEKAIAELKRDIRVLNADGSPAPDIIWDLDLVDSGGDNGKADITGNSEYGWRVYLYINKKTTRIRPLIVKYTGVETDSDTNNDLVIQNGVEELINPAPYITGEVVEPGTIPSGSDGYVLELQNNGVLRMVLSSSPPDDAMAIAFWSDRTDRQWRVVNSGVNRDLEILDSSSSTVLGRVSNIEAYSVQEVVQEINSLNLEVKATPLVEYPVCELATASATDITSYGSDPALMENHMFVYYEDDTRIFLDKPNDLSRSEDWFGTVKGTPVRYYIDDPTHPMYLYELTYTIGERAWLPYSEAFGTDEYLESIDEPAALLDTRHISLRHGNVIMNSLRLKINDKLANAVIDDYDKEAGVLRLNRSVVSAERVDISYAYNPDNEVPYDAINLNPGQLHLPDGYRLFFGVYIIPSKIVAPGGGTTTFSPNLGYAVANSASEVISAVDNLTNSSTGLPMNAKLLGLYQTNSQGEIDDVGIVDIRTHGGGLDKDVDLKKLFKNAPEAQFFADVGYWDGEPYAGSGVIVVQGPNDILGSDDSLPTLAAPADGGFFDTTGREDLDDIRRRLRKHGQVGQYNIVDLE